MEEAKKKWQGLRDTFRKEYNKVVEHKSGDEGIDTGDSSWPYFDQMLFLKDVVAHRKLQGNVSPKKKRSEENVFAESATRLSPTPSDTQDMAHTEDNASKLIRSESDVSVDSPASHSTPVSVRGDAPEPMQPPSNPITKKRKRNMEKM